MASRRSHPASGTDITALPPFRRNALGIGLMPQTRDIFASLPVEENLLAAQRGTASLDEAYTLFPRLKERRRNGGGQLSGGEQQMLAIARTLMTGRTVLLLDKPLEGQAPVICEQLMQVFRDIAATGDRTVVLVEQHAEAVLADPLPWLGALREAGTVAFIPRYQVLAVGRYADTHKTFSDHENFVSSRGVGLNDFKLEKPARPRCRPGSPPPAHATA